MKVVVGLMAILLLPLAPVLIRAQRAGVGTSATQQTTAGASGEPHDEVKAARNHAERVDELVGTVVDEDGKTVAGVEVTAFLDGRRVDRVMKTNESGRIRVPRGWRPDDPHDSSAMLLVRQGDSRLGWLDLRSLLTSGPAKQEPAAADGTFRIVLWPRTQTVRGTLVDPGGKPLSDIRVAVDWLTDAANHGVNQYDVGGEELGSATTDGDGTFVIRLPEGSRGSLKPHDLDWQRRRITIKPDTRDLGRIALAGGSHSGEGRRRRNG